MRPVAQLPEPVGLRVRAGVREQIRRIADQEGNPQSAVMRRALAIGLAVISGQQSDQRTTSND